MQEIGDLQHHLSTLRTKDLSEDEFELLKNRIGYLMERLESNMPKMSKSISSKLPVLKSAPPPIFQQWTMKEAKTKFLNTPNKSQRNERRNSRISLNRGKAGHLHCPSILPKSLRKDPFVEIPAVSENDLKKGIYNLVQSGLIPKDVDISAAFTKNSKVLTANRVQIHSIDKRYMNRMFPCSQENLERFKLDVQKQEKQKDILQLTEFEVYEEGQQEQELKQIQQEIQEQGKQGVFLRANIYKIEIRNGELDQSSIHSFKIEYYHIWGAIKHILKQLCQIAVRYKIGKAYLDGHRVAELASSLMGGNLRRLFDCFCNQEVMFQLYKLRKRQYSRTSAICKVQSVIRMFLSRLRYRKTLHIIEKVMRIQKQFKLQKKYKNTLARIQLRLAEVKNNLEKRQVELCKEWNEKRVEIHIPSYSVEQFQRMSMSHFRHREGLQLSRLFCARDSNVEMVIYVSPLELDEEVIQYYQKVLQIGGVDESKIRFVYPENSNRFYYSCSLTKLLYFSPQCLHKIRQLVDGRRAYIVPGRVGQEEFLVAEYLNVGLLSPSLELCHQVNRKSYSRQLFMSLGLPLSPGCDDIGSKEIFIQKLTFLVAKYMFVSKWVFKIDSEFNGRGTAYFSLDGIKEFNQIKEQELTEYQIVIIQNLITALLPLKTTFAFPSLYNTFDEYLDEFLRKGGIIEAYPPSKTPEQLGSVKLMFFISPNGLIQYLNSMDCVIINDFVQVGGVFPQQSIPTLNHNEIVSTVAQSLFSQGVYGYVTLSLLTFHDTRGQLFWARSIKLQYDEYISTIQLVDSMTNYSHNNTLADLANEIMPTSTTFMYLPLLYHPGMANNKYKTLFQQCRKEGLSFDMDRKIGSLILPCDQIKYGVLSLLSIRETHRKAVKLMTDSLNFLLHFAGSVVKMPADTLQTDVFYFIDIVAKVRLLNKEYEIKELTQEKQI